MASLTHIKHPSIHPIHPSVRPAILLSIEWKVSLNQAQVDPSFEWENNKTARKEQ